MSWTDAICSILAIAAALAAWRLQYPKPKVVPTMKRKFLSDVIELVKQTKSRRMKVDILKTNMCRALAGILRMNYDPTLVLDLDLDIQYRPNRPRSYEETLNHSSKTWAGFLAGAPHTRARKNLRLRHMLEALEINEAQLFLDAAQRKLNLGISRHTLRRCFPEIFKDKR